MRTRQRSQRSLDIALLFDAPEENWRSMDLAGEMLFAEWQSQRSFGVNPTCVSIHIPSLVRRVAGPGRMAFNADRALARYAAYPIRAFAARRPGRLFHVVDHSYAQLVHALPGARTGVYCHDLDALTPFFSKDHRVSVWRRALARVLLEGMRAAAVVFHSTTVVGRELEERGLVPHSRLVRAPYGVGREFHEHSDPADHADAVLRPLAGRPFLLHVGSEIARKRLDVLFDVFARLRSSRPELRLVQQGAVLSATQRAHVDRLGIGEALLQPAKLDRPTLAGLYRRARAVLVPSEAEGFGFPVIEALACGAAVIASDLPVLREVGGDAIVYAPMGDVPAWAAAVGDVVDGKGLISPAARLERARLFTWTEHARILRDAYEGLVVDTRRGGSA